MLYRDLCYKHPTMYVIGVGRDHEIFMLDPDLLYIGTTCTRIFIRMSRHCNWRKSDYRGIQCVEG